jgi:hypothetical protein
MVNMVEKDGKKYSKILKLLDGSTVYRAKKDMPREVARMILPVFWCRGGSSDSTTRMAPPSLLLSEPREGAFVKQQRMMTREVDEPQMSSSNHEVTDKEVAKEVIVGVET